MSLKGLRHTNSRSIHLVILNRFPPPLSASYAVNQLADSAYIADDGELLPHIHCQILR